MMLFSELIPQPLLLNKRRGAFGEPTSLSKFREGPQGEFGQLISSTGYFLRNIGY
jgi:hypothetical protein